jgi:hypothetical protein
LQESEVIRFRCPFCAKTLKVPDNKAGTTVACPRCHETCPVLAESASSYVVATSRPPAPPPPQKSRRAMHAALALVAATGVLSLLVVAGLPLPRVSEDTADLVRSGAMVLTFACPVLFLVLIYAYLTTCPACGKWWARTQGDTSSLERHVTDEGGVRQVRAMRQTTYVCQYCRHTWTATYADEYRGAVPPRRKPDGGAAHGSR